MLLFDVPTDGKSSRRAYTKFISGIRNLGFLRLQKSVYVLLLHNGGALEGIVRKLSTLAPDGSVCVLPMSLAEFERLETIRGEPFDLESFSVSQLTI